MGYMAQDEENQSSPSDSRTRSQSEEQSPEQEISQPRLLFRIRVPPTSYQRTPIHRWDSSSSSDSETELREFDDLCNYLPRWPVTGRRGRCSIVGKESEGEKSVSEIGKRVYPENKLTIGKSNSVKDKNMKQEKSVSESHLKQEKSVSESHLKQEKSVSELHFKQEKSVSESHLKQEKSVSDLHFKQEKSVSESHLKPEKSVPESRQIGSRVYSENKLTVRESKSVKAKNLKQENSVSESGQIGNRVYPENKLTIHESKSVKGKNLKQEIENDRSVSESGQTGNKIYSENKLTSESNSVKSKNLSRKRKQRAVIGSDDDFGNTYKDGFGTKTSGFIIPCKEPPLGNNHHKKKKHDYIHEREIHTEHQYKSNSPDLAGKARWRCIDPEEASTRPEISSSMGPKVLTFDLNDLPPIDQEDDAV